jgi:hypothetical protein
VSPRYSWEGSPAPASSGVFAPASMRIHPLTRVVAAPDGSGGRIELFLELLDRWNDPTKALGNLVVELYASDARAGDRVQLQRWTVPLRDPDENAQAYDRVTRSYHITLADVPAEATEGRRPIINVRFASASGEVLTAVHAPSN